MIHNVDIDTNFVINNDKLWLVVINLKELVFVVFLNQYIYCMSNIATLTVDFKIVKKAQQLEFTI